LSILSLLTFYCCFSDDKIITHKQQICTSIHQKYVKIFEKYEYMKKDMANDTEKETKGNQPDID